MGSPFGVKGLEKSVYGAMERPDVEALVPASSRHVLDVGCGAGNLGAALKRRHPDMQVTGIEMSEALAREAMGRLDDVLIGTIEEHLAAVKDGDFDCVIFADVLEHMINPHQVLVEMRRRLTAEHAVIVASVPNVRHWSVLRELVVRGRWGYAERGLLDSGHLRFFTLESLDAMFRWAGYEVESVDMVGAAPRALWWANRLLVGRLKHFIAYQYLVRARPTREFTPPDAPWWGNGPSL